MRANNTVPMSPQEPQGPVVGVLPEEVDSQEQADQEGGSSLPVRLIRTLTSATYWHHAPIQELCSKPLQASSHHLRLAFCPLAWSLPQVTKREATTSLARSFWRMWTRSSCQTSLSLTLLLGVELAVEALGLLLLCRG